MDERVTVFLPPPALADVVVCCIRREIHPGTARATLLPSHVPANVYGCLNLVVEGAATLSGDAPERLPKAFVTGPFAAPLLTLATAPLRSLSLVVQPWLLRDWFGLEPQAMVNAVRDTAALPAGSTWQAADGERLREAIDQPEEVGAALLALAGRAPPASRRKHPPAKLAAVLLQSGSVSATAQALGLGERQFGRNFRRDYGLAPKIWLRVKRFEGALAAMTKDAQGDANGLGGLATDAGYADQAHMSREFRAISGATPLVLRRGLHGGLPGFWAFQPARVGFVQDGKLREK